VNAVLGTELADGQIRRYLDPIGFTATPAGPGLFDVVIPSWRPDSATEIDVIEEVARMHGYSAIERTMPTSVLPGGLDAHQKDRRLVRSILTGAGPSEAWTTTFVSEDEVRRSGLDPRRAVVVSNPLVADDSLLRPSLLPGLVRALAYNASHRQLGVWLFEVGNVFSRPAPGEQLPDEREIVAVALGGADATEAVAVWNVLVEGLLLRDTRLEAAVAPGLHPTRTARILIDDEPVGFLGEIDPAVLEASSVPERVGWIELDLRALLRTPHGPGQYEPVSRYPSSDVDLSFEVDEGTPAGDILRTMRLAGVDLLVGVELFDVYRGTSVSHGRRSLTFRAHFQAPDHTLTDEELAAARNRLIETVERSQPATLRA
jgi:phenylalanyl-tRNA synthetase beta chain